MANESKLRTSSELAVLQWSRKGAPAPKLAAPIGNSITLDTTLKFTQPILNVAGTVETGAVLIGIRKSNGWTENCTIPAGGLSADGLTATGVIRGVRPGGYDIMTGSADFADSHDADEPVFCNIQATIFELIRSVIQGLIASGGSNFIIGVDAAGTVTLKRSAGAGTSVGFVRWNTTTSKTEYSNDGTSWVAIDDTVASVLFKVSATDTTPGYALTKLVAGTNITITQTGTGGNETLVIATSLPAQITEPIIYTPAYLTGDNTAENNYLLWGGITDGSFAFTLNGTLRTVTGVNTVGAASMAAIATIVQTKIRALTGGLETCAHVTDHFVISSVNTTSSSAITVTSATGSGTDISGAGAFGGLGCDVGHGIATAKALDQAADVGKVALLNASGRVSSALSSLPDTVTSDPAELNKLDGASANVTAVNMNTLTAGPTSNANGLHKHLRTNGESSWTMAADLVIAHGLGVAPNWIRAFIINVAGSTNGFAFSSGSKVGAVYSYVATDVTTPAATGGTDAIGAMNYGAGQYHKITVTADATNLTFATAGDAGTCVVSWECGV